MRNARRRCSRAGAEVTTAENGEVALHLLASTPFDLVLLDMQMPGKDGYTTVAELRASGASTPVLALTADTTPADVERCLAAGCNGHLAKPVAEDVLGQALAMHLHAATD
jgi:CheY-like chemotaxis protein